MSACTPEYSSCAINVHTNSVCKPCTWHENYRVNAGNSDAHYERWALHYRQMLNEIYCMLWARASVVHSWDIAGEGEWKYFIKYNHRRAHFGLAHASSERSSPPCLCLHPFFGSTPAHTTAWKTKQRKDGKGGICWMCNCLFNSTIQKLSAASAKWQK